MMSLDLQFVQYQQGIHNNLFFLVHTNFLFVSIHQQSFNTHIYKLDITFIYIQIHIKTKNHKNLLNIYSTLHTTTLLIIYI